MAKITSWLEPGYDSHIRDCKLCKAGNECARAKQLFFRVIRKQKSYIERRQRGARRTLGYVLAEKISGDINLIPKPLA